jgi:Xaa-Pro aminopeptidase
MSEKSTGVARVFWAAGEERNDVRWATGFDAPDPFGMVWIGGRAHLFVGALEAGRARKSVPGAVLHVLGRGEKAGAAMAEALKAAGEVRVAVGKAFPVGLARDLEAAGVAVDVTSDAAFPERAIKNAQELAAIAESQRAAVAAVREAEAVLRASEARGRVGELWWEGAWLTSERLRNRMESVLQARGCRSEDGLIVAGGRQAACPHEAGHGVLKAGEAIVLDVFPRNARTGYWGDLTRTVSKGEPKSRVVAAMWRATLDAQRLALGMVRPGVKGADIQTAVEEFFAKAGFPADFSKPGREKGFIHSVGHGVGLDIHEAPRISKGAGPLAEGNVVTVEPGLYDPAVGGVRIEDTVVVTRDGPRFLARLEKRMCV